MALVNVATEPPGGNCDGGGIAVMHGLDTNANGVLDTSEVQGTTSYVCNGAGDTASQVLSKLKTVDGNGSGLDADLLQGKTLQEVQVPVGTVLAFAGTATPVGWLACNGQAVSRTTYLALFTVLGITHGPGDGINTFNVPDYRGRFLRGVDGTANRDPDKAARTAPVAGATGIGNAVGSIQGNSTARPVNSFTTDTTGSHTHSNGNFGRLLQVSGGSNTTVPSTDVTTTEPDLINSASMLSAGAHSHFVSGGGDNETRPINANVDYIIKY
jgi:hypothetical protein